MCSARPVRPSKHAEALGDEHKLGQRLDPELLHQIAAVRFDRPLRASELMRDLLVQSASRDPFEDLKLTRSQAADAPPQRLELVVLLLPHASTRDGALDRH